MAPIQFLIFVICILAGAACADRWQLNRRRRILRELARQWGMHFATGDRLRLSERLVGKLPVPGAANVRVTDLFFSTDGKRHQYLFTLEYGVGVTRAKVGRFRVAGFQEPIGRGARAQFHAVNLTLAPHDLVLPAAYAYVREAINAIPDAMGAATEMGTGMRT